MFTGTLEPRKNITRLLEAFAKTKSRETLALVIAGKKGWLYKGIFETVKKLNLANRVILTGFVDDEDLPSVYSSARAFVYPSLYEGFGLPPLEAMACGTPVITSDTTSLPEVVGKAALLVDPTDAEAIAAAMRRLMDDVALGHNLLQLGLERAKEFSWQQTARCLMQQLEKPT